MSTVASGITYGIRFTPPDMRSAESVIVSHVAKMNAMTISIPVGLNLTSFNAQAAQVNAQLAAWQGGISVNVGGAGGVAASPSVTNQSTTTISNFYNNVANNINTINNAAAAASRAAGAGGGGHGGGGHGLLGGGLARHLGPFALLRTGEQILRNEQAYGDQTYAANSIGDLAKADVTHRGSYDSIAFGVGRYGRAIRELNPFGEETTTRDLERQQVDIGRQDAQIGRMRGGADFAASVARELRISQSGEGYSRSTQTATESSKSEREKIDAEREKRARPIRELYDAKLAEFDNDHSAEAATSQIARQNADERAVIEKDYRHVMDALTASTDKLKGVVDERTKIEMDRLNRLSDVHRDLSDVSATESRSILGGSSRASSDAIAMRARDAVKAKGYDLTMRPDEAEAAKMEDAARTDLAIMESERREASEYGGLIARAGASRLRQAGDPLSARRYERESRNDYAEAGELGTAKRGLLHAANSAETTEDEQKIQRERESKEMESAARITSIRATAEAQRLANAGQEDEAERVKFSDSWDQRLAHMREALKAAEGDNEAFARRRAELDAAELARGIEVEKFLADQARRRYVEVEDAASRLAQIQLQTAEMVFHAQGQFYLADQAAFEAAQKAKIDAATRARDAQVPGSPEFKQKQDQLDATKQEVEAAKKSRDADQGRQVKERSFDNAMKEKELAGQKYTAQILEIKHKADKEFGEAAGNPALQLQIRRGEQDDLLLLQKEIGMKATSQRGDSIQGIGRSDIFGRYGGSPDAGKETLATLKGDISGLLRDIRNKIPGPAIAG